MVLLGVVILLIVLTVSLKIYSHSTNKFCTSKKRLDGKTCLVTGGTMGLGLEIAKEFAKRGARVIIACPFEQEGLEAQRLIINETGNVNVIFKLLDLASLESTRKFALDILNTEDRLDILMNNAGICAEQKLTGDGFNSSMQINYYGHFLITNILLPLLKKTGTPTEKARILNTTSMYHFRGVYVPNSAYDINNWSCTQLYGTSKLCLLLFATELKRRLEGHNVIVNTVDPGAAGTTIFKRHAGTINGYILSIFLRLVVKTPWEGAQTALHVALSEDLGDISGEYFRNCQIQRAKEISYDGNVARKLWDETVQLVKLNKHELNN